MPQSMLAFGVPAALYAAESLTFELGHVSHSFYTNSRTENLWIYSCLEAMFDLHIFWL